MSLLSSGYVPRYSRTPSRDSVAHFSCLPLTQLDRGTGAFSQIFSATIPSRRMRHHSNSARIRLPLGYDLGERVPSHRAAAAVTGDGGSCHACRTHQATLCAIGVRQLVELRLIRRSSRV